MNLAIFTPALNLSAIGKMASLVTQALVNQGHQVTIIRTEDTFLFKKPTHFFSAPIINWNQEKKIKSALKNADVLIYQIGNNYQYHRGGIEWLAKFPGIVCLHDYFLANLFYEWAYQHRDQAQAILKTWYGETLADRFFSYSNFQTLIEELHNITPMTEWITSMATGVITHSSWSIERILNTCHGPIYTVPLPYPAPKMLPSKKAEKSFQNKPYFTVLTFGNINFNKKSDSIIRAIAKSKKIREKTHFRLVGAITQEMKQTLSELAKDLDVNLFITGEVDEAQLREELENADVICCLRYPTLEAASASVIEAMLCKKPIVVYNLGFYQELPDHLVFKIPFNGKSDDLQKTLEFLYQNSDLRLKIGKEAAIWASATFNADLYAKNLIKLCKKTIENKSVLTSCNYFIQILTNWDALNETESIKKTLEPIKIFG